MPQPKNKEELLVQSKVNFNKLFESIDSLPENEQLEDFPKGSLNRNIRDLLAHLHHWHLMMLDWHSIGMSGEKLAMPELGYTWKDLPALNKRINDQYKTVSLVEAKTLVNQSYNDVRQLIKAHSNEELFEKKRYHWTGTTSVAAYLISATSSHYDTVLKLLKKFRKQGSM
jgi:hypothetical protein